MKLNLLRILLVWTLFLSPLHADIFGTDDRHEITRFIPKAYQKYSKSIAVGVLSSLFENIEHTNDKKVYVDYLSDYMCPEERFNEQPSITFACTGFLVGADLLVTAGHCATHLKEVRNEKGGFCDVYTWMFDYTQELDSSRVSSELIYKCQEIIYAVSDDQEFGRDFALIRLDRKVSNRSPLPLSKQKTRKWDHVSMLGHPMGMPIKYVDNAYVFKVSEKRNHLLTNLDAFAGNSGSPVFNDKDEVIGILVAGNPSVSTYKDKSCSRYNNCDERGKNCKAKAASITQEGFPYTYSRVLQLSSYLELINVF